MTEPKKTDAWMPLWIGAYLADTQHLTRDEHGAYLLLMMAYWRNDGPLPDDDKRLGAIVKATPREWKSLRTTMAEFFTIADGAWSQKRVDAELEAARARSKKNTERAKKASQARWEQAAEDALSIPTSDAPSILEALPEHVLEECPTSHTNTLVTKEQGYLYPPMEAEGPSPFGAACLAMKAVGLSDTSPGNPKLRALVQAGATVEEFVDAARKALSAKAGFSYALTVVENSRKAAATMASQLHQGTLPAAETAYQRSMRERMAEVAPDFARKAPGQPTENATDFFNAIDVTARTVELLK